MSEQPRQPAGSPRGGEYAPAARGESSVELSDDSRGIGWSGSFHAAPPDFDTAEQVVNYFTEHPPPDETVWRLRRLLTAQRKNRADDLWRADARAHLAAWEAQNPVPKAMTKRRQAELEAEHAKRREAFATALHAQMSQDDRFWYSAPTAYTAFLATESLGRWRAAASLPAEERQKIEQLGTGWYRADGTSVNHRDLITEERLGEIADQVMDPEAERNEMLGMLREISRGVDMTAWTANQTAVRVDDVRHYQDEDAGYGG